MSVTTMRSILFEHPLTTFVVFGQQWTRSITFIVVFFVVMVITTICRHIVAAVVL